MKGWVVPESVLASSAFDWAGSSSGLLDTCCAWELVAVLVPVVVVIPDCIIPWLLEVFLSLAEVVSWGLDPVEASNSLVIFLAETGDCAMDTLVLCGLVSRGFWPASVASEGALSTPTAVPSVSFVCSVILEFNGDVSPMTIPA